jgi:hypothetical protein
MYSNLNSDPTLLHPSEDEARLVAATSSRSLIKVVIEERWKKKYFFGFICFEQTMQIQR